MASTKVSMKLAFIFHSKLKFVGDFFSICLYLIEPDSFDIHKLIELNEKQNSFKVFIITKN